MSWPALGSATRSVVGSEMTAITMARLPTWPRMRLPLRSLPLTTTPHGSSAEPSTSLPARLEAKITATRRALGRQHAADALADLPRAEEALRTARALWSAPLFGDGTASTLTASIPSGAYSLSASRVFCFPPPFVLTDEELWPQVLSNSSPGLHCTFSATSPMLVRVISPPPCRGRRPVPSSFLGGRW